MRMSEAEYRAYLQRGVSLLRPAPPVSRSAEREADFQARVLRLAKEHGWLCFHAHDAHRSQPGYPDITAVRPGQLVFLELKVAGGKLTPEQATWLSLLQHSVPGVVARCVTPELWSEIVTLLTQPPAKEPL